MSSDKCTPPPCHHYNSIQNIFTALKIPVSHLFSPLLLLLLLTAWQPWIVLLSVVVSFLRCHIIEIIRYIVTFMHAGC